MKLNSTLGLAKFLKNGVARLIAPDGTLDGFLTGELLLEFMASVGTLGTKGVTYIGFTVVSQMSISVELFVYVCLCMFISRIVYVLSND